MPANSFAAIRPNEVGSVKCPDTQRHSMPVATATVAWNLPTWRYQGTLLHGDCTAPVASCNDVGMTSALSAPSVRANYDYGMA